MSEKRKNPYQRLKEIGQRWASKIKYPRTKLMWTYPKEKLNAGWHLTDLWERVQAAEQLGYDVKLVADDSGIKVMYVEKAPELPFEFRY